MIILGAATGRSKTEQSKFYAVASSFYKMVPVPQAHFRTSI